MIIFHIYDHFNIKWKILIEICSFSWVTETRRTNSCRTNWRITFIIWKWLRFRRTGSFIVHKNSQNEKTLKTFIGTNDSQITNIQLIHQTFIKNKTKKKHTHRNRFFTHFLLPYSKFYIFCNYKWTLRIKENKIYCKIYEKMKYFDFEVATVSTIVTLAKSNSMCVCCYKRCSACRSTALKFQPWLHHLCEHYKWTKHHFIFSVTLIWYLLINALTLLRVACAGDFSYANSKRFKAEGCKKF